MNADPDPHHWKKNNGMRTQATRTHEANLEQKPFMQQFPANIELPTDCRVPAQKPNVTFTQFRSF